MLSKVINYIFTATALGKYLDGKKRIIGASLIALSMAVKLLEQLSPIFPEIAWINSSHDQLQAFLDVLSKTLAGVGFTSLTAGFVHAAAKTQLPEAK